MKTIKVSSGYDTARSNLKEYYSRADFTLDSKATEEQLREALLNLVLAVRNLLHTTREPGEGIL
jgi:hypothetical protein